MLMIRSRRARRATGVGAVVVGVVLIGVMAVPAFAAGKSYTTLQSGFTQELYGTQGPFAGGVAFAKDGDVWVDVCGSGPGSQLFRYDAQTLLPAQHGTSTMHKVTQFDNVNVGCGLVNGKNRNLYSNTSSGVVELNPDTGATINGPYTFSGSAGNVLGITTDPVTGDLVYVGNDGTLVEVNEGLTTNKVFSTALKGQFLDGIFFDPTGDFLFASDRSENSVAIVKRNGSVAQKVNIGREPDGIAFHAVGEKFVVTNNTDGTMSRIDFAGNDPTKTATVSQFASGGFRGDLSQVGPDGALYVTQDGTRFDDSTTGEGNSIVRICCGFVTPPGAGTTTTTAAQTVTTSGGVETTTTVEVAVAAANELPRTGGSGAGFGVFGAACVAAGLALVGTSRRRRRE